MRHPGNKQEEGKGRRAKEHRRADGELMNLDCPAKAGDTREWRADVCQHAIADCGRAIMKSERSDMAAREVVGHPLKCKMQFVLRCSQIKNIGVMATRLSRLLEVLSCLLSPKFIPRLLLPLVVIECSRDELSARRNKFPLGGPGYRVII